MPPSPSHSLLCSGGICPRVPLGRTGWAFGGQAIYPGTQLSFSLGPCQPFCPWLEVTLRLDLETASLALSNDSFTCLGAPDFCTPRKGINVEMS